MDERVKTVSFHGRDTRMVGCTGDAQIVISNVELEKLIIRVLKAIDSPVDVRSLRSFVMSRLPIMDIHLVPVGGSGDSDDEERMHFEIPDLRENPEEGYLRNEAETAAAGFVESFLDDLSRSVRGKEKQYNRMISVLWHCYLISGGGTQLEVAELLGVSDSLVSDYRKRIEANLQELSFTGINEARQFEKALKTRVKAMLAAELEHVNV
jgi:predicted XRE-type DNA-binding protein